MALQSRFFRGEPRLEAAAVAHAGHIVRGATGPHVQKIQSALMLLDDATIEGGELQRSLYGPSTAAAVVAYKRKRNIVNRSYQTQADDIVGKMTMAVLDAEMIKAEQADVQYSNVLKAVDDFILHAKRHPIQVDAVETGVGWRHAAQKVETALTSWRHSMHKNNG